MSRNIKKNKAGTSAAAEPMKLTDKIELWVVTTHWTCVQLILKQDNHP